MTIPSEANNPTQVPALLIASIAYSTWLYHFHESINNQIPE